MTIAVAMAISLLCILLCLSVFVLTSRIQRIHYKLEELEERMNIYDADAGADAIGFHTYEPGEDE